MRENDVRGRKLNGGGGGAARPGRAPGGPFCAGNRDRKGVTVKLAFSVPFAVCILVQKRE